MIVESDHEQLGQVYLLLVENEPILLAFAQDALEDGGYAVMIAEDGHDSLRLLNSESGNLAGLVTDINLGAGPDGWEIARHARELTADLPVVYVTGDNGHEWPSKGVPNSLVIHKPYTPAQLVTAVSGLITAAETNRTT